MKNKLEQFAILTVLATFVLLALYLYVPQFIYLLILIEAGALLVCGHLIFFDQRNTTSKFAWVLTILLIPYIGLFFFLLIGKNPRSRRIPKKQRDNELRLQQHVSDIIQTISGVVNAQPPLSNELFKLSGKSALLGNQVKLFHEGEGAFNKIIDDIKNAQHHVHVFYFIIKGDSTGEKLLLLLAEKARQGIEVRLMYDSLGSIKLPYHLINQIKESGGEVKAYDLVNSPLLSTRINWRNHRKIVVIDGRIAHIGGMNIGDEYLSKTTRFKNWRDTNMRVAGPAVLEIQEIFIYDWLFFDKQTNTLDNFLIYTERYFPSVPAVTHCGETVQILYGGPYDSERIIKDAFIDIIGKATKSIKLAMPYFIPDVESLSALSRAARCGIKIQIIIPGKGDRGISFHGSNSFVERLLAVGIEVYFYDSESFIHCKILIVDDQMATIGSTNFDIRSFYLNHELSAFVYGPSETINELIEQFSIDLKNSTKIVRDNEGRSKITILKEKISELFIPLL